MCNTCLCCWGSRRQQQKCRVGVTVEKCVCLETSALTKPRAPQHWLACRLDLTCGDQLENCMCTTKSDRIRISFGFIRLQIGNAVSFWWPPYIDVTTPLKSIFLLLSRGLARSKTSRGQQHSGDSCTCFATSTYKKKGNSDVNTLEHAYYTPHKQRQDAALR